MVNIHCMCKGYQVREGNLYGRPKVRHATTDGLIKQNNKLEDIAWFYICRLRSYLKLMNLFGDRFK